MEPIRTQQTDFRNPDANNVAVMKETIIFITPPQPNIEMIMKNGWSIKLAGVRKSDGFESHNKFKFNYVPDDFYSPCIFCELRPDSRKTGRDVLPNPIGPARPGVKKRRMPDHAKERDPQSEAFIRNKLPNKSSPKFRLEKIPCIDDTVCESLPALDKLCVNPASQAACGSLKLKPLSALQNMYTTSQAEEIQPTIEKNSY